MSKDNAKIIKSKKVIGEFLMQKYGKLKIHDRVTLKDYPETGSATIQSFIYKPREDDGPSQFAIIITDDGHILKEKLNNLVKIADK